MCDYIENHDAGYDMMYNRTHLTSCPVTHTAVDWCREKKHFEPLEA